MKLDHTFIAIRERSILEIFDLALHVIRDHFRPLMILLLINALPWIVIDWLIANWMAVGDFRQDYHLLYFWLMLLLVVNQAQIGTAFLTYYLGQAMFVGRPGIRETIRGTLKASGWLWWSQGCLRMVIPVLGLAWLTRQASAETLAGICGFALPALVALGAIVRGFRPFAMEMFLLEKTPVTTRGSNKISFARRSMSLHNSASSDLFGRFILTTIFLVPLTISFYSLFVVADTTLNIQADSEISLLAGYWIVALWMAAGFATVVRFLSYVDIRIRQEGWSVELRMRAEGLRVMQAIE